MTGLLYAVGRHCARHHRLVIATWVVLAVGLAFLGGVAGNDTSDNLSLPGTGSQNATDVLTTHLPGQANGSNPMVLEASRGTLDQGANAKAVAATVKALEADPHVIKAISPLSPEGATALGKEKRIAYISIFLDLSPSELDDDEAQAISDDGDAARDAGLDVAVGGYVGATLSKANTEYSEAVGIAAAVIILLFAFGTVTAMALPIVTAVIGLVTSLALITFLGHLTEVASVGPTLATMIGLGVGIDYALFIITRHKAQLATGMPMEESIARSTATAGGAVVFAGATVIVALISLALAGIPIVGSLGYTAAVAVAVAVLAANTLLPALLGALGPRIDSLRVKLGRTHPDDHEPHGWRRWAGGVVKRPWRSAVASVLILLALAAPLLGLQLGQTDAGTLSTTTTARQAFDMLAAGFGPGINGPLLIAEELGTPAQAAQAGQPPATDPRLTKLNAEIAKAKGVVAVSPPILDKEGRAAIVTAIPTTGPSADGTEALVDRLRDDVIPKATEGTDVTAYVGGQTAGYMDLADRITDKLPQMILIVVGLSFLILLVAFRSVLVPLKAAVMNLLSVGAAYGIVTLVFQDGFGAELIGLEGSVPIVSFVPLLMFAILFGLSMDYEVFLLTQMDEQFKETKDAHRAVVEGLASTGRVITSAALIMFCVFSSFLLVPDPTVKQFGLGLALAVAIDATLVRCLLVPAVMALMGDAAWWLPRWLDRILPKISIEGEEYFAQHPAPPPAPAPAESA